jgi:hypothetical protein
MMIVLLLFGGDRVNDRRRVLSVLQFSSCVHCCSRQQTMGFKNHVNAMQQLASKRQDEKKKCILICTTAACGALQKS